MKGALLVEEEAELVLSPPLALQPASTAREDQAQIELKIHFPNFASRTDRRNRI
jgi:hypothetical protein